MALGAGCAPKAATTAAPETAASSTPALDVAQPACARQAEEVEDALVRLADRYLWEEVERLVALAVAARSTWTDARACEAAARTALTTVARRWAEAGIGGGSQTFDLAQRALRSLETHFPGAKAELHHVFGRLEWAHATRVAGALG
ncbi:MAG TPA: hypothetical protein VGB85_34325, partial [Nannocystis sp.]